MSTNINITVGDDALLNRVKQQQSANRQAQLEREASARLEAQATAARTTTLTAAGKDAAGTTKGGDCEYIPDDQTVLDGVVPMAVRTALFSCLLQTSAAEHAARRVAMKNATDAAGDMVRDLNLRYNRGRQGKITQEIAEITGAVEAMA